MKVLMVHTAYQQRGGEDESTDMEAAMLRAHGHEVVRYSDNNDRLAEMSGWQLARTTVWNADAYRTARHLIREHRPDVVHVQNFFPLLSPSIHAVARREGVPVVQSLRNYRLLCVNGLFFRDGSPCEDCLGRRLQWPGVIHRCYRGSAPASAVVATMNLVHRARGTWQDDTRMFVALSNFVKQKFVQAGWDSARIAVKPNFVFPDPGSGSGGGGYALFAGRLSPEKGLGTLLRAWSEYDLRLPLKIVGDGPSSSVVAEAQRENPRIEWLGRRPLHELYDLMGRAAVVVFPSEWYETFGRIAIEAFAKGTPVVISDLGALAELVEDGTTGYRFSPGDASGLAEAVKRIVDDPSLMSRMRENARREYETKYTAETNINLLVNTYRRAIAEAHVKKG